MTCIGFFLAVFIFTIIGLFLEQFNDEGAESVMIVGAFITIAMLVLSPVMGAAFFCALILVAFIR